MIWGQGKVKKGQGKLNLGRSKLKKTPSPNVVGGFRGEERKKDRCKEPHYFGCMAVVL